MQTVEILFKRSLLDVVKNLFRHKAKRFPAVAKFKNVARCDILPGAVRVEFAEINSPVYYYPIHTVKRVKKAYNVAAE